MAMGSRLEAAVAVGVLCGLGLLVAPGTAAACTTPAPDPSFELGMPLDGDGDVPTDVVPLYGIPIAVLHRMSLDEITDLDRPVPGTFTLTTVDGTAVEIEVRRVGGQHYYYELVPARPLAANTEHVLEGAWTIDSRTFVDTLEFTTGAGPVARDPAPPHARLLNFRLKDESQLGSCSATPSRGTCIYDERGGFMELTLALENGAAAESMLTPNAMVLGLDIDGSGLAYPCVVMRTRALNGVFSEPVTVCAPEHPEHVIDTLNIECTSSGLVWPHPERTSQLTLMAPDSPSPAGTDRPNTIERDAEEPKPSSDSAQYGCTALTPARSSRPWLTLLIGLFAGLVLLRKR